MCKLLGLPSDTIFIDNLLEMISERIGSEKRTTALINLGLISDEKVEKFGSPLDTISNHLASILSFDAGERDMVLMRHEVNEKINVIVFSIFLCIVKSAMRITRGLYKKCVKFQAKIVKCQAKVAKFQAKIT